MVKVVSYDPSIEPEDLPVEDLFEGKDYISNEYLWKASLASQNLGRVSTDITRAKKMDIYVRNLFTI
jgi:hypothetical protein